MCILTLQVTFLELTRRLYSNVLLLPSAFFRALYYAYSTLQNSFFSHPYRSLTISLSYDYQPAFHFGLLSLHFLLENVYNDDDDDDDG